MIKLRRMRWTGHVIRMRRTGMHKKLVGKPGGKRSLGRPKSMWVENIKIDLWDGMDWIIWIRIGTSGEVL
jgi:hypothetical protein